MLTPLAYGDRYPLTLEGRIIAMILMISGVGLFGTLSGLIASYFLGKTEEHNPRLEALLTEVKSLREEVAKSKREF